MNGTTLPFDQARDAIHSADRRFQDFRVPWEQLLAEPGMIRAGERSFRLDDDGLGRVCARLGAPAHYMTALPEDLRSTLLNHHFRESADSRQVVSVITSEDRLVGLGRADLGQLNGEEVLDAVREGSGRRESDLGVANLHISDDLFQLDVVSPVGASEITPGDVIEAGVRIRHSPTGDFATVVEAYALRLICRNGMTHRECIGPRRNERTRRLPAAHADAKGRQKEQIRRLTSDGWGRIEQRLRGLSELTTQRADFDQLTSSWLQRVRLSPARYTPHLRRAWEEEGSEATLYSVMNAFTRAANAEDLPARGRLTLARLGGLLAFQSRHLCPRCFAVVAESN